MKMSQAMQGKTAVVFGVANKRSIAWAIAQRLQAAGAKLAITYQNERLKQEAGDLIAALPGAEAFMCDVSSDEQIPSLFADLQKNYGKLDAVVHSVASEPVDDQKNDFAETTQV